MQYNATQCNTMQYNTMQYNAIHIPVKQYNQFQNKSQLASSSHLFTPFHLFLFCRSWYGDGTPWSITQRRFSLTLSLQGILRLDDAMGTKISSNKNTWFTSSPPNKTAIRIRSSISWGSMRIHEDPGQILAEHHQNTSHATRIHQVSKAFNPWGTSCSAICRLFSAFSKTWLPAGHGQRNSRGEWEWNIPKYRFPAIFHVLFLLCSFPLQRHQGRALTHSVG